MHERFASSGLEIVAVQSAKPRKEKDAQVQLEKTTKWVEGKNPPFPVLIDPTAAYVESLDLPAGPYPVIFLIDAEGRAVWVGSPGGRKAFFDECEVQIERLIKSTKEKAAGSDEPPR